LKESDNNEKSHNEMRHQKLISLTN